MAKKKEVKEKLTLREYKTKHGLTYNALSKLFNCSQGAAYNWCNGGTPIKIVQEKITKKTKGVVSVF